MWKQIEIPIVRAIVIGDGEKIKRQWKQEN